MFLAMFDPGKEMAVANFFLAIFCLFTVTIPLLLITRGDKTEANRDFLVATFNPWSQISNETDLAQVVVSEVNSLITTETNMEETSERNAEPIRESNEVISLEIKVCDELDESLSQSSKVDDEILAA